MIILIINILWIVCTILNIWLVFRGFVVAAKKAQRAHEEGEKKCGGGNIVISVFATHNKSRQVALFVQN